MASPFPGMDPYLEALSLWPSVHARLINTISDMLTAQVAPQFIVTIEERVTITDAGDPLFREQAAPDVYVVQPPASSIAQQGITESLHATAPVIVEALYPTEIVERYIEIRDAQGLDVITTIEILSPRNKAAGSKGRDDFLRKRHTFLASPTNWMEIDLLRGGQRPAEVAERSDYYVLQQRGSSSQLAVWFVDIRDPLPVVTVPLRAPSADALLDLGAALADVYSRGTYGARIDYDQPPPKPTLRPADAAWASAQVGAWRSAPER